jgi:nucleotide-binding universal stress UspA family protein
MQYIPTFRPTDARALARMLTEVGVDLPDAVRKAIALADAAEAAYARPHRRVLDLDPTELIAHAALHAAYNEPPSGVSPMRQALMDLAEQAAREAAEVLRSGGIDTVIEQLRPEFDDAAKVVREAAALGIRSDTSPQWVMDAGPEAVTAWQRLRPALRRLDEIATIRVAISTSLHVAPVLERMQSLAGPTADVGAVDYSCAFVDPASAGFTIDGSSYHGRRVSAGIDWLRLAPGGLRLNSPSEVEQMLAVRAAAAITVPLDRDGRAVLTREDRTPDPDDQVLYVGR